MTEQSTVGCSVSYDTSLYGVLKNLEVAASAVEILKRAGAEVPPALRNTISALSERAYQKTQS